MEALTQIGAMAYLQRSQLNDILEETKADSRCMKILAVIATLHLPSNLLAVSMSCGMLPNNLAKADTERPFFHPIWFTFPLASRTVALSYFRSGKQWVSM